MSIPKPVGNKIQSNKIKLVSGELAKEKVDVLVSPVGTDVNLLSGAVSSSLLQAGGPTVQQELTKACPQGLQAGGIAETTGGKLTCKKIYHVVLKQWMNVNDSAEKLLRDLIRQCLKRASTNKYASIAFCVLGAGKFYRFPAERLADIMLTTIENYLQSYPNSSLKTAAIVIHPKDEILLTVFKGKRDGISVVLENCLIADVALEKKTLLKPGLEFQLIIGCLSQVEAEVVVNTTQSDLELNIGAVSRTLVEAGADGIEAECRKQFPLGLPVGKMVQSGAGGSLLCKKIFHVVLPMWKDGDNSIEKVFQSVVLTCLQEASKLRLQSVAFPFLGTGYNGYPPAKAIMYLLTAITKFIRDNPARYVKTVAVVVHHKDVKLREIVENQLEHTDDITNRVMRLEKADGTSLTGGDNTHVVSGMVVSEEELFEQTAFVRGEREALAGNEIKVINLLPNDTGLSMTPEDFHYRTVESQFFRFLMKDLKFNRHIFQITKIEYVVNPELRKRFRRAQNKMAKQKAGYEVPALVFHGSSRDNILSICYEGFRKPDHPSFVETTDVGWYGNGIYFSPYPRFAMNYMQKTKMLLVCKVLQGKVYKCEKLLLGAEKKDDYDSHVDPFGKELIIYYEDCILPCYVVHFDVCKRFKFKDDKFDPNEKDDTVIEYLKELDMHKGEEIPPQ